MKRLFLLVFALAFMVVGCGSGNNVDGAAAPMVITSEGVELYIYKSGSEINMRILNTNNYPVRIRHVIQYRGESTRSINLLEPDAEVSFRESSYFCHLSGFYVYAMDGILIGWIGVP